MNLFKKVKKKKRFRSLDIAQDVDLLEHRIIPGKINGKRSTGRPWIRWVDQLKSITCMSLHKAVLASKNRNVCKTLVNN